MFWVKTVTHFGASLNIFTPWRKLWGAAQVEEDVEEEEESAEEGGECQSKSSQLCRQLHNKFDLHNFMLLCFLIKELIKLRAEEVVELLRVSGL